MTNIIDKARTYAILKHAGQERDNGVPFISHPLRTAKILMARTNDENLIAAGLLHDILEDTPTTYEELKNEFDEDIASLVLEVTKTVPSDRRIAQYFPHLKTYRGLELKFADRLDNLFDTESTKNWSEEKKRWYFETSIFVRRSIDDPIHKRAKKPISNKPIKGQMTVEEAICKHCNEPIVKRNPSGDCDHLCYPENCKICASFLGKGENNE